MKTLPLPSWCALCALAVALLFCGCSTPHAKSSPTAQASAAPLPSVIYVPIFILSPGGAPTESNSIPEATSPETTIRFEPPAPLAPAPSKLPSESL